MARKPKIIDSALIKNDELRPWTIDIHENEKLQIETSALDIVLTYTTPQKFAGTLGVSPLDARPKGYQEFEHTLNDKLVSTLKINNNNNNKNYKNNNYNRKVGDVLNLPVLSPSRNESSSTVIQQTIVSSNRNNNNFLSNRDRNGSNSNPATNTPPFTNYRSNSNVETDRLKLTLNNNDNNCRAATAVNSRYYTSTGDNYHKNNSSRNKNNNINSNKQNSNTSASVKESNTTATTTVNSSSNAYIDKIYDDHDLEHIDQLRHLLFLKTSKSKYRMTKIKSMNSLEEIRYIGSPEKAVKSPYSSKLKLLPVLTNKMKNNRIGRPKTTNA